MRLRTLCGAYKCQHGAPYRNAVPGTTFGNAQRPQRQDNLLTTIDYIIDRRSRSPRLEWTRQDGMVILFALVFRPFAPLQTVVDAFMTLLSTVFGGGVFSISLLGYLLQVLVESLVLGYVLRVMFSYLYRYEFRHWRARYERLLRRARRHYDGTVGNNRHHNLSASELLLGVEERNERDRHRNLNLQQRINMTEREMLAEALRRSVQDQ
jgi:hypothetical protein